MGNGADLQYTLGLDGSDFDRTATASTKAALNLGSVLTSLGAAAFAGSVLRRGLEFNQTMFDGQKAVAAIIQQFQGLDAVAADNAATKAMRQLVELEPKVAGSLADIVKGFVSTAAASASVGLTVEQNIDLVGRFANALAKMNLPIEQVGQELRSILTGNISQDSAIAKDLNIDNATIEKLKASGKLYETLVADIGRLGGAVDNAATTFSSFSSAVDQVAGALTKELFGQTITGATELTAKLNENRQMFLDLGGAVGLAAREVGKFAGFIYEATTATSRMAAITGLMISDGLSYAEASKAVDDVAASRKQDAAEADAQAEAIAKVGEAAMESAERQSRAAKEAAEATAKAGLTNKEKPAKSSAKDKDAFDSKDAAKTFDEIITKQQELDELKRRSALDEMTTAQKVAAIRDQIAAAEASEAALKSDPFTQDQVKILEAEMQRVELQRELYSLQKQQNREAEDAAKKAQELAEQARRDRAEKTAARTELLAELAVLREQAAGHDKKAQAIEKEFRLEQAKQAIMAKTGASEEDALRLAKERVGYEERIAKRKERQSQSGGQDNRTQGAHIGGVTSSRLMGGHLSDFDELQRRSSPLSSRRNSRTPTMAYAGVDNTAQRMGRMMGRMNTGPLSGRIAAATTTTAPKAPAEAKGQGDPVVAKLDGILSELTRIRTA